MTISSRPGMEDISFPLCLHSDVPAVIAEYSSTSQGDVKRNNRYSRRDDAHIGAEDEPPPEIWEPKEKVEGTGDLMAPWWLGAHF